MVKRVSRIFTGAAGVLCLLVSQATLAQTPTAVQQDRSVGTSINYVFATDLGSGVYELDGRILQIYQLTYEKALREATQDRFGIKLDVPVTVGFFNFKTRDVLELKLPSRVDSFSVVPGVQLDYLLPGDWHLQPYVRAGFSVASSSVDGWLYGTGLRVERQSEVGGWTRLERAELAIAGVDYRQDVPSDRFVRLRQGLDFTRPIGWRFGDSHVVELGLYGIFDLVIDSPDVPVAGTNVRAGGQSIQAEFGFTFATRPRYKIWHFNMPRLGFGYRLAGDLSAWRFVIGEPF